MLRITSITLALLVGFGSGLTALGHNNPTFREDLLLTVPVSAEPVAGDGKAHSEPFSLDWPKKTVQLIWRVVEPEAAQVNFSVTQDGTPVAEQLGHEATSERLQGDGFTVTDVSGAGADFTLEIYAKVLDRSVGKKP